MGIDINGAKFLLHVRNLGVDFARTAMIGRQSLLLTRNDLRDAFRIFGDASGDEQVEQIFTGSGGYAEQLLIHLGAKDVHSFDFSAYEGATHLHDMNMEIAPEAKDQYTTVLDGGSLEHVFNFPTAIKNCMEMVKAGGHYLAITPANNYMGHGFYQFSPEMYFNVFSRENGFEVLKIIAFENRPGTKWYSVRSPVEVRGRVTLVNRIPVMLFVVARKLAKAEIFKKVPQQSDYQAIWRGDESNSKSAEPGAAATEKQVSSLGWIKKGIPLPLKKFGRMLVDFSNRGFDPRFFSPFDPAKPEKPPGA
jgi:hypothetical protein